MIQKLKTIEIITEPPPTMGLSETQLDEIVTGTSTLLELCGLEKVHCHTQVCTYYIFLLVKSLSRLWGLSNFCREQEKTY